MVDTPHNVIGATSKGEEYIVSREYCPACGGEIRFIDLPTTYGLKIIRVMCECEARQAEENEAKQAVIDQMKRASDYRKRSGMPLEQQDCRFDNFDTRGDKLKKHLEACKYYADHFTEMKKQGKGILFTGSIGSGKTHLAAGIANHLIDKGLRIKYAVTIDLLQQIQSSFNRYDTSTEDIIQPLKSCPLLILDDIGAEKPSDWTMSILHSIIDNRYSNYRPTIITTNLTSSELTSTLNSRTVDRILDKNKERFIKLSLAVDSYRTKKE